MINPKIVYEDTSHKTLGLAIANKNLDVTDLSIISNARIGNLEIGVLGASHYAKVKNGDETLSEVFACRRLEGDMDYHSLADLNARPVKKVMGGFEYEFQSDIIMGQFKIEETLKTFEYLYEDFKKKDNHLAIKELFPSEEKPIFDPATYILAINNKKDITVLTIHAYPEEGIIVKTLSNIKLN